MALSWVVHFQIPRWFSMRCCWRQLERDSDGNFLDIICSNLSSKEKQIAIDVLEKVNESGKLGCNNFLGAHDTEENKNRRSYFVSNVWRWENELTAGSPQTKVTENRSIRRVATVLAISYDCLSQIILCSICWWENQAAIERHIFVGNKG